MPLGGFLAGGLSALAYGSFAVPIKAPAVVEARVHPLVFQSYKSLMCFLSAWFLLLWADFRFTAWAVLAAAIWVANGVLAIISIHLAGLGVAQSLWSATSVFVSFAWGKAYFREPISNVPLTLVGLLLMAVGMLGLGWIASRADTGSGLLVEPRTVAVAVVSEIFSAGTPRVDEGEPPEKEERAALVAGQPSSAHPGVPGAGTELEARGKAAASSSGRGLAEAEGLGQADAFQSGGGGQPKVGTLVLDRRWHRRRFSMGVAGSVLIGCLAGSMMVCLKLSPPDRQGDQYTVSFGIGVAIVTLTALAVYYSACACLGRPGPAFQARVAAGPACLAGLLWSLGNYLSVLAVDSLGMAIGWPLVQCSLIVSSCWALFWYRELSGAGAVLGFLASALVILTGVSMLAWFGL